MSTRGRPLRLPEPSGELTHVSAAHRFAWLLTVSRLHHDDSRIRQRGTFVSLLAERGVYADQSTVSRWESARTSFPRTAISAYEEILGVPSGTYSAIADLLSAIEGGRTGHGTHRRGENDLEDALDVVFERLDQGTLTGADWYHFASALPATRVYFRSGTWRAISTALISELSRSTHAAFPTRFGTATRLLRHPSSTEPLLDEIESFVHEPHAQAVGPPISLLAGSTHPRAAALITTFATHDDELVAISAASTAANLLQKNPGAIDPTHLITLAARLIHQVPPSCQDFAGLSLATALPDDAFAALLLQLSPQHRGQVVTARQSREIIPSGVALREARRISASISSETGGLNRHEPDLMLSCLLREALFSVVRSRRQAAFTLLALSPYRHATARAVRELVRDHRKDVAARAAAGTPYFAHAADHAWILDELRGPPKEDIHVHLLSTLAYSQSQPTEEAITLMSQLASVGTPRIRSRALTVLGMSGADAVLQQCLELNRPSISGPAAWWLRQGAAIRV